MALDYLPSGPLPQPLDCETRRARSSNGKFFTSKTKVTLFNSPNRSARRIGFGGSPPQAVIIWRRQLTRSKSMRTRKDILALVAPRKVRSDAKLKGLSEEVQDE